MILLLWLLLRLWILWVFLLIWILSLSLLGLPRLFLFSLRMRRWRQMLILWILRLWWRLLPLLLFRSLLCALLLWTWR